MLPSKHCETAQNSVRSLTVSVSHQPQDWKSPRQLSTLWRFTMSLAAMDGSVPRTIRDESNAVTFSDADRRVPYPHNRPLYVTSRVNGIELKRTFSRRWGFHKPYALVNIQAIGDSRQSNS
ncbi:hypothetical protein RHMOL_Rhmol11G0031400 [Rhododendron molle]|uniref:Uncharacterized protein n=1 Tax=Rhododendron molle TaxID=49168 RepID=A0ACC0LN14_RHOML|nr:hypothetical protein RHMOL_Rhmol11G0031400 [Rhododendron molle]